MSDESSGGLFSNGLRVPLKGVEIAVRVSGASAETTVSQRYKNTEKIPVEAVYSFPLEESSAVSGFEIEIGGKLIKGRVEEREKAFEAYDDAMQQGHGAFLVDQDRPNIFTASVGNLLPDQEAVVRLSYVSELQQHGDSIRLLIPTTISPRYIPLEQMKKIDPSELDHIRPPTVLGGVSYGLKLKIEIEAGSPIKGVECPSHPASVSLDGGKASVELSGSNIQLDQDFVLNIKLAKPHEASALVARDGDGARAVMLSIFPDMKSFKRGPCEFIFIVDRSGSMDGDSIVSARAALLLALRSLEEGDRFNIISFGGTFSALFEKSAAYDQKSLDSATKSVESMTADMGGTELLGPLTFLLESAPNSEMPRQAVLLTDGQIGNEAECVALVSKHASRCRIFTFGIGNGVSESLVKSIARASGGQADFIHPNERIEPKVLRQFARMSSAFLKNIRVDWGQLKTDLTAPSSAPQLFDGDRCTLFARVIGGSNAEVAILADSPNGALRFPVLVDLEHVSESRAIPVLMARKAIQEIEEGTGTQRGSAQANRKENAVRARVLELALRYQILSSATSFIAVEERAQSSQSAPAELRRIPIALTKGWTGGHEASAMPPTGAFGAVCQSAPMTAMSALPPQPSSGNLLRKAVGAIFGAGGLKGSARKLSLPKSRASYSPPPAPAAAEAYGHDFLVEQLLEDELLKLVKLQRADGSFELTEEFAPSARIELKKMRDAIVGMKPEAGQIIATLIALQIFEHRFGARRDEWQMVGDKATRWLAKQTTVSSGEHAILKAWAESEINVG